MDLMVVTSACARARVRAHTRTHTHTHTHTGLDTAYGCVSVGGTT